MLDNEVITVREHPASGLERRSVEESPSIDELLERRRKPFGPGWLLDFGTPPEVDVYNSSAPIKYNGGKPIVIVREEEGDEFSSQNRFFSYNSAGKFSRETNLSNLSELSLGRICQDPAIAYVQGNLVVTQVEVDPASLYNASQDVRFSSAIYAGETLDSLRLITKSRVEDEMKGLRLVELQDGRVGIFTRPRSPGNPARGGLGKICFTIVESLDQINSDILADAPHIQGLISGEENTWRGTNYTFLLPNGDLAVLDHRARFEKSEIKDSRGYYPGFFTFNPNSRRVDNQQILATIADFHFNGQVRAKRSALKNVFHPSALLFPDGDIRSNYAVLWGGAKDSKMAAIWIPNPLDSWLETHPRYKYDVQSLGRPALAHEVTGSMVA